MSEFREVLCVCVCLCNCNYMEMCLNPNFPLPHSGKSVNTYGLTSHFHQKEDEEENKHKRRKAREQQGGCGKKGATS